MPYVYVPFRDASMDTYADALVIAKNQERRVFGQYKKIDRAVGGTPLSTVGWNDRLYTLAHGSGTHSGVCVNTNRRVGEEKYVTGEAFADLLIASGLKNTTIDVRLWTCWGGKSGTAAWSGPAGNDAHSLSSFALRVAVGFKTRGYNSITVTGYRKLVSISSQAISLNGGRNTVQNDNSNLIPITDDEKIRIKVRAI